MNDIDIVVGMKVRIVDHDYGNDGRSEATVTAVSDTGFTVTPKTPWSSQGRTFTTMHVGLDGDMEWSATRFGQPCLTFYRQQRYGGRLSVKSFIFDQRGV